MTEGENVERSLVVWYRWYFT